MRRGQPSLDARRVLGLLLLLAGCKGDDDTILLVHADLNPRGQAPSVRTIAVTVSDGGQQSDGHSFTPTAGMMLKFPTSFSLQLPRGVKGPISLKVLALDAEGVTLAEGVLDRLEIKVGQHQETTVDSRRAAAAASRTTRTVAPPTDGSTPPPTRDGPVRLCGNGSLEDRELCDTGIPAGRPGACPTDRLQRRSGLHDGSARAAAAACSPASTPPSPPWWPGIPAARRGPPAPRTPIAPPPVATEPSRANETCDTAVATGQAGACPAAGELQRRRSLHPGRAAVGGHLRRRLRVPSDPRRRRRAIGAARRAAPAPATPIARRCAGTGARIPARPATGRPCPARADACPTVCQDTDPCTTDVLVGSGCQIAVPAPAHHPPGRRRSAAARPGPRAISIRTAPPAATTASSNPARPAIRRLPPASRAPAPPPAPRRLPAASCGEMEGQPEDCSARCLDEVSDPVPGPGRRLLPRAAAPPRTIRTARPPAATASIEAGETCDTAIAAGAARGLPHPLQRRQQPAPRTCCCRRGPATPAAPMPRSPSPCRATAAAPRAAPPCWTATARRSAGTSWSSRRARPATWRYPRAAPDPAPPPARSCPGAACSPGWPDPPAPATSLCELDTIKTCQSGDGCCPEGCSRQQRRRLRRGLRQRRAGDRRDLRPRASPPASRDSCPAVCDDYKACTMDITLGRVSDCTRKCTQRTDHRLPHAATAAARRDAAFEQSTATASPPAATASSSTARPAIRPAAARPCAPTMATPAPSTGCAATPPRCNAHCEHQPILTCSGASSDRCCPTGCTGPTDVDCGTPAKA